MEGGNQLSSLPPELLVYLTKFIPTTQLPLFATLSSLLRKVAEEQLWTELYLMEPKSVHETYYPTVDPVSMDEMTRRRNAIRQGAKERIESILIAGSKRPERFKAVTTINARTYRYSCHHLVTILLLVREHLIKLRVACAGRNVEYARWGPYDGFYAKMADFDPKGFPLLEQMDISPCHNASYDQVARMISLAPNISFLRISARDELQIGTPVDPIEEPWEGLPIFHNLRHIVLNFPDDDGLPAICSDVLGHAPHLEKLVVSDIWADLEEDGWSDEEQGEADEQFAYFAVLDGAKNLRHFDWRCGSFHVFERFLTPGRFQNLTTLVIDGNIWSEERERIEIITLPPLSNLKTLVFRTRHPLRADELKKDPTDIAKNSGRGETLRVPASTIDKLVGVPNLTSVRFSHDEDLERCLDSHPSQWELNGTRGIIIERTFHSTRQLVHLRTLTRAYLKDGKSRDDHTNNSMETEEAAENVGLAKELRWEHGVAFDGVHIPAHVMDDAFKRDDASEWREGGYAQSGSLDHSLSILNDWVDRRRQDRQNVDNLDFKHLALQGAIAPFSESDEDQGSLGR